MGHDRLPPRIHGLGFGASGKTEHQLNPPARRVSPLFEMWRCELRPPALGGPQARSGSRNAARLSKRASLCRLRCEVQPQVGWSASATPSASTGCRSGVPTWQAAAEELERSLG
jgi:hypothetical protein